MSNVLIGIIGVILFIGLALAGALFLGPRFQESVANSKASAMTQGTSQIAASANMSNVDTGTPVQATATAVADLVTANYLKSQPTNPVTGNLDAALVGSGGQATGVAAAYAIMKMPAANQNVCEAIARQSGQAATDVTTGLAAIPSRPSGCFKASAAIGSIASGDLVAFGRV